MGAATFYCDHCGGYQCPLQGRQLLAIAHPAIAERTIHVCPTCKEEIKESLRATAAAPRRSQTRGRRVLVDAAA